MNNINGVKLEDLLPQNMRADAGVIAAARALDGELSAVTAAIEECVLIARVDELPEQVIDLLAWQWHVDFYDYNLSLDKKRSLVKKSLDMHRIKGTPAAVEAVVTAAFKSAKVVENWEYGGQPYHFKVEMVREGMPSRNELESLSRSINAVKNVRSWIDEISFQRDVVGKVYVGGVFSIFRRIEIYPPRVQLPSFELNAHIGAAQFIYKEVKVNA